MGTIINLNNFRKNKCFKIRKSTETEEFTQYRDELLSQWNIEESKNNINSFIANKLQIEQEDFVNDRNSVASLEESASITIMVTSPLYKENITGWVASFIINDVEYKSHEMETETKARLYCVLLYYALMEASSNTLPNHAI